MPTPTRELADSKVKGGVDAFIAVRRGRRMSWYDIALDLHLTTKGRVKVTPETLRTWWNESQPPGSVGTD